MYDFSMPAFSEFTYWFTRSKEESQKLMTFCIETGDFVGAIDEEHGLYKSEKYPEADVMKDYELFKQRPECLVGTSICRRELTAENCVDIFERLFTGIVLIRAHRTISIGETPDNAVKRAKACIDWLRTTDFYTAPASTQYHEAFHGGLLYHTIGVYNEAMRLVGCSAFTEHVSFDSAALVALCHDWCKIGTYTSYLRNVQNETTGKWEKVPSYKKNQTSLPLGHGVSSMFYASRFFKLSPEEALAIRWHMGAWRVTPSEHDELQKANEECPLVHLIQFADQLSITNYAPADRVTDAMPAE